MSEPEPVPAPAPVEPQPPAEPTTSETSELTRKATMFRRQMELDQLTQILLLSADGVIECEPMSGAIFPPTANTDFLKLVGAESRAQLHGFVDDYVEPEKRALHAAHRLKWCENKRPVLMDQREILTLVRHDGVHIRVGITLFPIGEWALLIVRWFP